MAKAEAILYFKYLAFFMIGLIVGRITMAIQYAVFKELARAKSKKKDLEEKTNP